MSNIKVNRSVTLSETTEALREHLDPSYTLTPHGDGSRETIGVKHGAQFAGVRLIHGRDCTTFRVHGRGLLVGLVVNELTIARKVGSMIRDSFGSSSSN